MRDLLQRLAASGMVLITAAACSTTQAASPVFTTLYQFPGGTFGDDSYSPLVIGSGGVLYGTTIGGGSSNSGLVFSLTPPAAAGGDWTATALYSFPLPLSGYTASPVNPVAIGNGGALNGTDNGGGYAGSAFSLTPPSTPGGSWTPATLYNFIGNCGPGCVPSGGLAVGTGGVLFGTAEIGGTYPCCFGDTTGTVFSLTPPPTPGGNWTLALLHSFGAPGDGTTPTAGLTIGGNGVLYGTTSFGGAWNAGTVFSLTTSGAEAVLYSFTGGSDGGTPSYGRLVIGSGGVLYGMTTSGGAYLRGAVYALTPPEASGGPWAEAVIYSFQPKSGQAPEGGLALGPSGELYGTTTAGGSTPFSGGTLFGLTPPSSAGGAWKYTVLHSFAYNTSPWGGVTIGQDSGGNLILYGTTTGVKYPGGTVYSLMP